MWNKSMGELTRRKWRRPGGSWKKTAARDRHRESALKETGPAHPLSHFSEHRAEFHADFDLSTRTKLLERCIALTRAFETDRIRCFDFWRLDDQKPYRAAIDAEAARSGGELREEWQRSLLLENEMTCNTATGEESTNLASGPE